MFDGKQFCEYKHRAPVEIVTHLIVDGDVSLQQGRPDSDEDGGIQVDTMIKNFMHLMCIPSRGYNLVIFSLFSLTSFFSDVITDVYATTTTPGLLFHIPAQCKQS